MLKIATIYLKDEMGEKAKFRNTAMEFSVSQTQHDSLFLNVNEVFYVVRKARV